MSQPTKPDSDFLPLPTSFASVKRIDGTDCPAYTADQVRAAILADRARLAPAAPSGEAVALVPKWEGEFTNFQQWVNKARSWLESPSHRPSVCIDAKGRRCAIGKDFMLARDEDAFPVRFFWEFQVTAPSEIEAAVELPTLAPSSPEEVAAFEAWAEKQQYDMTTHPLHWLFLNERTYAARQGWKSALEFARATLKGTTK